MPYKYLINVSQFTLIKYFKKIIIEIMDYIYKEL